MTGGLGAPQRLLDVINLYRDVGDGRAGAALDRQAQFGPAAAADASVRSSYGS